MDGELEAVADVATGAALAHAVEPDAGETSVHTDGSCLNCRTELIGAHCHNCGQKGRVHRNLHAFGHDILHSVLHFDGKIWRTLPLLFLHPGKLTRRYVHGERVSFVSPIALFLFTVFFSFAVFGALLPDASKISANMNTVVSPADALKELNAERKELQGEIAELKAEKQKAVSENLPGFGWIDAEIARHESAIQKLDNIKIPEAKKSILADSRMATEERKQEVEVARMTAALAAAKGAGKPTETLQSDLDSANTELRVLKTARSLIGKEDASKIVLSEFGSSSKSGKAAKGQNDAGEKKIEFSFMGIKPLEEAGKHAMENPQLLLYKVQSNAYKFSWALVPISLPFVWLLFFWRRQFKMFDHAVFITYSITFMMLLGVIGGTILAFSEEESFFFVTAIVMLSVVPPVHIYRQVHHAYQTTHVGALWRTVALSVFALIALTLFAIFILVMGITG